MKWLSTSLLLLTFNTNGSTLFFPDSDTAILVSLVSNTASTVSNTLKILEVVKKTSNQIDRYNFLAMRRYFIARRIEQHVNDISIATKMKASNLRELNQVMLRLKTNLIGLKSNIDFMAMDLFEAENFTQRYSEKLMNSMEDQQEAHNQEILSASEGVMSKHVQNTAMNTAMSTKVLSKIRGDNLEYQKTDISMKKGELTEKLRREQFYKKWLGVNKSKQGVEEI
jgi:hypothetical protein